jgi:hypothetical protein
VREPGAQPVDLITCRLKSKLLTVPGAGSPLRRGGASLVRRVCAQPAPAEAVTELLTAGRTATAVVVLRDLNDEPQAVTKQILHGPPGSEIDTAGYGRPDQGDTQRLWNVAARIPAEHLYFRIYQGRRELIDHMLVSRTLVTKVADGAVTTGASRPCRSPTTHRRPRRPRLRPPARGRRHRPLIRHATGRLSDAR